MLAGSNTRGDIGNLSTDSFTHSSASADASSHPLTQAPATSPTSTCIGNCITSVPGCDVRGPTTQTGLVTVTDVVGKLWPVPCPDYISMWNNVQASKTNETRANATTTRPPDPPPDPLFLTTYPPFIFNLESSMIGSCDIFGASCQTGTIEAMLNLTSTVATTTVACSDYLRAQQRAVVTEILGTIYTAYLDRREYATKFGRSPQCATFAERIRRAKSLDDATRSYHVVGPDSSTLDNSQVLSLAGYTLSGGSQIPPKPTPLAGCPANASEFDQGFYPLGIHNHYGVGRDYDCCGWCNLHVPELQIFYFPEESEVVGWGHNATNATRTRPGFGASAAGKRAVPSPNKQPVTAVVSGYT